MKISVKAAIDAMSEWVRIRTSHGYRAELTPAEVDHSALLRRLLSGKPPLPEPPPRSFSYPWYELIETGEDTCFVEIITEHVALWNHGSPEDPVIIVNQNPEWRLQRRDGEDLIVTNPRAPGEWRLTNTREPTGWPRWHIKREETDAGQP